MLVYAARSLALLALLDYAESFFVPMPISARTESNALASVHGSDNAAFGVATTLAFLLVTSPVMAADVAGKGASAVENAKITTGGASTLQSGRTIAITRGVNLDR